MDAKKKYIKEYYDKNAAWWSAKKVDPFFHELGFRKFEKLLKNGNRVLDIGCAYGIHLPLFLGIGEKLKYIGIDISRAMVKLAKSRYPSADLSVADIATYKPKKKFDAFWAAAILMHIPAEQIEGVLRHIESMMRPGAVGYLTLPVERMEPESETDRRHFTLYTKERFSRLAKEMGWKILASEKIVTRANFNWNWYLVRLPK